ncbi:MAG: carbon-nitrogen hydrolase family protein, partial [Tissierellia bacterium]|nr:carbon-nitrogen hydrolase family protein [Tissierellia bacterium]
MRYIESLIARLDRPDLVVLPELALSSYMANQSIWAYADENSQITSAWAKKMAEKYNTFIAVGYVEQSQGEY